MYNEEGADDDEIEGKRTFNLENKMQSNKYCKKLVKEVKGTGEFVLRGQTG